MTCLFTSFGVSFNKQIFLLWSNQYLWLVPFLSYVINLFLIRGQESVIVFFFLNLCLSHLGLLPGIDSCAWYEVRLKFLY